jgi:hypothetical protein
MRFDFTLNEQDYIFYKPNSSLESEFFYALGAKDKFEEVKIKEAISKVVKDIDPKHYK